MLNYLKLLIVLFVTIRCHGRDYIFLLNEERLFQPCDAAENNGKSNLDELWQTNVTIDYADDAETIIVNGDVTITVDIPDDVLWQVDIETFYWKAGNWAKTVYTMKRKDFCNALFAPNEYWHSAAEAIPEEDRICPFKKGNVYRLINMKLSTIFKNIRAPKFEGKTKIVAHIFADRYSTCVASVAYSWEN